MISTPRLPPFEPVHVHYEESAVSGAFSIFLGILLRMMVIAVIFPAGCWLHFDGPNQEMIDMQSSSACELFVVDSWRVSRWIG